MPLTSLESHDARPACPFSKRNHPPGNDGERIFALVAVAKG